jgi:hypothetical protein
VGGCRPECVVAALELLEAPVLRQRLRLHCGRPFLRVHGLRTVGQVGLPVELPEVEGGAARGGRGGGGWEEMTGSEV